MADLYHNLFGQTVDQYGNPIPMPSTAPPEGYNVKTFPESIADAPQAAMPQPLTMFDAQKEFQQYDQPEPWGVDRTIKTIIGAPFRAVGALDAVLKNAIGTPTPEDIALNARALLDKDESTKATGRPASMLDTFMGTITGDAQRGMNAWNRIVLEQKQRAAAAKAGLEQNLGRQSLLKGSNELAGQALDLGIKFKTAREKADLEVQNLRSTIDYRKVQQRALWKRMGLTDAQIHELEVKVDARKAYGAGLEQPGAAEEQFPIPEERDVVLGAPLEARGAVAKDVTARGAENRQAAPLTQDPYLPSGERKGAVAARGAGVEAEKQKAEAQSRLIEQRAVASSERKRLDEEYEKVRDAYEKKGPSYNPLSSQFLRPRTSIVSEGEAVLQALKDKQISFLDAMAIKRGDAKLEDLLPTPAPSGVPDPFGLPPTGATPTPAPPYEAPSPGLVEPRSTPKPLAERTDDGGSLPRGKAEDLSRFGAEDERQARPVWDEINAHSRPPITDPVKNEKAFQRWLRDAGPNGWAAARSRR